MLYYYPKLIQNKSRERYKVEVPLLHNSGLEYTCIYFRSKFTLYYTRLNYPDSFPL